MIKSVGLVYLNEDLKIMISFFYTFLIYILTNDLYAIHIFTFAVRRETYISVMRIKALHSYKCQMS